MKRQDQLPSVPPLARRMGRVRSSPIMELLARTAAGDYISFASGVPDPALYPVDLLREVTDRVLSRDGRQALQYGTAEGHDPLREWIARQLGRRGLLATPEQVLITNGSQQALDLAARLFLDPGDRVLLESPSYAAAIQIFESCEADYVTVPIDEEGMVVDDLPRSLAELRPKLIFTLPNFQNPTGITQSLARRQSLAESAAASGIPLLEDDAYHDLRYEGEPLPPVTALAENPYAVYTGTLSKTVAPGLRIGFLYAARALVERLAQLKQLTDLQPNSLTQRVALEFCLAGHLEPQIRRLRETYRARRDTMLAALEEEVGGAARWSRPAGGMFIFVWLPARKDAARLLPGAMRRGVVYVPGAAFHATGGGENTLRLNFVSADEAAIRRGIGLLAPVLREEA